MKRLTILYDKHCSVCCRCRVWLQQQPAFVPLDFLPLQSENVARRFPGIEKFHPEKEIVVISDTGELWQGASAWVMCLWALREYREWALRLADPALLPFARRVCGIVSENRHKISQWFFGGVGGEQLRQQLETLPSEEKSCAVGYCKPA
jgi:predicted DCC family thiol-disulfide oxidoreductase YuxK